MATEPVDPSENPTDGIGLVDDLTGDPDVTWTKDTIGPPDWTLQGVVIDPVEGADIDEGAEIIPPPPTEPEPEPEPIDPPAAPSNLTATLVGTNQIDLAWIRNSTDESGFRIERSETSGSGFVEIATVGLATFTYSDINLPNDIEFFYRVIAFNSGGDSPPSNEASETTVADVLAPDGDPTNLIAVTTGPGVIDLTWTDNATNELTYRIERSGNPATGFVEIDFVLLNVEAYQDTTANPPSLQFFYRVRAANAAGVSAYSNVASGGGLIYSNGYANRYAIKVRPNQVSNTLSNFMIRMSLQFDALKLESIDPINGKVRTPTGDDIRFEELTGLEMNYDLRAYDGTAGTIECWIESKIFFVEHAFHMFVGNENIVAPEADAVAMWANVATMALDCLGAVDFSGKQTITPVGAAIADTLLGEAGLGGGATEFTVPTQPLFDGDTEQSSMCWIRAAAVGTDQGWLESVANTSYPGGAFAAWVQRYDLAGLLGGSVNLIKYGCAGENFETNSNRQTTDDQFIAQTWKGGQFPSLYVDGGSPEFQDAASGLPGAALAGAPGETLNFYKGLADWLGVFDEYIQFDRELSEGFINAAFNSQKSTANFLFVDPNEGATADPGFDVPEPGEPEPPTPQPTTDWEAFFLDRTLPVIPAADTTANVSTWSAFTAAIAAAAADVGNVGRVNLTADLVDTGSQQPTYDIQPNTTVIVDMGAFEIRNGGTTRVSMVYNGFFSDWNTGGDNSRITDVVTANGKTAVTFLNPITGLEVGDWVKVFTPRTDSTDDWRLGANIWARVPTANRIGQTYQVESINGNVVGFTDYIRDPINQYPVTAQSGKLWGAKYLCMGANKQGSLFLIDNTFLGTGHLSNISIRGMVYYHVIRPYIDNNTDVGSTSFPNKVGLGGVRGKMYDAFFDSNLTNGMGFVYAWNAMGGSSQNVAVNTDQFSRPYNMTQFRNYGDSSSFNLDTSDSDREMARKAGNPTLWGVNKGIVQDSGGQGAMSTHSSSVATRFKELNANYTSGANSNLFHSYRSVSGQNFDENIIEGITLPSCDFINDAIFQFYDESSENFFNGNPKGGNSRGEDNGCFGYLLRNNIIHWDNAAFMFLSGGWRGPLKFGSGNEIHIKKSGELFFFNPGSSSAKNVSQVLPDPRPGWDIFSGSIYFVYGNSGGRMGSLRNGCQSHWDFPIIDLSQRTTPYTLMDVASGCTLTGGAQLINPNNVSVTPATGAGNWDGFSVQTL